MKLIKKIPGPFLVFFGAVSLSFGGLIVKSFEGSTLWQILIWRSFFFIIALSLFLTLTYKNRVIKIIRSSKNPEEAKNSLLKTTWKINQASKLIKLVDSKNYKGK